MRRREKKWLVVLAVGSVALLVLIPPLFHLGRTAYCDRTAVEKPPAERLIHKSDRLGTSMVALKLLLGVLEI